MKKILPLLLQGDILLLHHALRLKNTRVVYQWVMHSAFTHQIGKNMEVYIDDLVVKSQKKEKHISNLKETFKNLHRKKIMLNP